MNAPVRDRYYYLTGLGTKMMFLGFIFGIICMIAFAVIPMDEDLRKILLFSAAGVSFLSLFIGIVVLQVKLSRDSKSSNQLRQL
jgi:hypothetical protein